MARKSLYPKVGGKVEPEIEEKCLSGPVITYRLPPEEIEKKYGKPEPPKPLKKFNVGWPEIGQTNEKHYARRADDEEGIIIEEDIFSEEDYTDPEWKY